MEGVLSQAVFNIYLSNYLVSFTLTSGNSLEVMGSEMNQYIKTQHDWFHESHLQLSPTKSVPTLSTLWTQEVEPDNSFL